MSIQLRHIANRTAMQCASDKKEVALMLNHGNGLSKRILIVGLSS